MEYSVKKAELTNESDLVDLSRKTINYNFRSFMGDAIVDEFINSGLADKEIIENLEKIDVLFYNSKIIGLCIWKDNLLHLLMISPEYQGTGAARYFIKYMCNQKLKKYKELYLECFDNNLRANAFYRKSGWIVYKSDIDKLTGYNRLHYRYIK